MMMDDKFLYQLQEQPDAEFVKNLRRQLGQSQPKPKRWLDMNIHNLIKNNRLVQVTALFVIAVIAVTMISPARAFVSSLVTNIAGQLFEVTDDYPGDNYGDGEEIIEPQVMSLGDALAAFPYDVQLPTNIPSEYTLDEDNVRVYVGDDAGPFANMIEFSWRSTTQNDFILLHITDRDLNAIGEIVAPDSVEEILLNDAHPAVLIRGGWNADQKVWVDDVGIRLRWSLGNLFYELKGTDQEQLLEIALSTLE
jgi:hypothetical protein